MSINNPRNSAPQFDNFSQFIGFYLAHMGCYLEDGENVAPILAIQKADGAWFERFFGDSYEQEAANAREKFNTTPLLSGEYAFVGVDGYYTDHDERYEALLIDTFECELPESKAYKLVVPYRSANSAEGLVIHQTKLFFPKNLSNEDKNLFLNHLWSGFCHHKMGFEFWNKQRDQSLEPIQVLE